MIGRLLTAQIALPAWQVFIYMMIGSVLYHGIKTMALWLYERIGATSSSRSPESHTPRRHS